MGIRGRLGSAANGLHRSGCAGSADDRQLRRRAVTTESTGEAEFSPAGALRKMPEPVDSRTRRDACDVIASAGHAGYARLMELQDAEKSSIMRARVCQDRSHIRMELECVACRVPSALPHLDARWTTTCRECHYRPAVSPMSSSLPR